MSCIFDDWRINFIEIENSEFLKYDQKIRSCLEATKTEPPKADPPKLNFVRDSPSPQRGVYASKIGPKKRQSN